MVLLDVPENVLERFWCLHAATIDGIANAGRRDTSFDGAFFLTLRARLCRWEIPLGNGQLHINDDKITGDAPKIIMGQNVLLNERPYQANTNRGLLIARWAPCFAVNA
jgi:hypothetical protein